ncbi:TonB-dependent receptor plug domain-containing protein [Phenylobacterium sp.]|uniref:TonB-dependent receptor plug domain-containing protein n=1 Tax=Phenylobacterium sp. TaxID=1871053 RepID=UPI002F400AC0
MNTFLRTALLGSAAASLVTPGLAQAQDAGSATGVSEIVVTGSRIRRDTFNAPMPSAVVTGEEIRRSGYVSLADSLVDLPLFGGNVNQQTAGGTLFQTGQARVDLRGLGGTNVRTLVLVDGRRHVFSDASSPGVDLNMLPQLMVERVDVVPGGASAVYGSEAIAGVVNIIMRKQADGFEGDVQTGVTSRGDGQEFRIGGLYGHKYLGDRLNVLVGGEIARSEPIMQSDRDWAYPGLRRTATPPVLTIVPASRSNASPYANFQLRAGASPLAVVRDVRNPSQIVGLSPACAATTVTPACQDQSLIYASDYAALQSKVSHGVIRGHADYAVSDKVKAFVDASYAKVEGYSTSSPAFSSPAGGGTMPVFITGDNAFLNGTGATAAQLRAIWTAAAPAGGGLTLTPASRAQIGKFWGEFGGRDVRSTRDTTQVTVGLEGQFDALDRTIHWNGYGQYGEMNGTTVSYGQPYKARVQQAVDAVTLPTGQIVCRDVTARAAGCVPWDLVNGPSQEAVAWANAVSTTDQTVKQTVFAASFDTNLLTLPAGPLGVAGGLEYRKEESSFVQDALGAANLLFINQIGTRAGSYDVKEAYGEMRVPLLKDLPFAEELSVEFAGRAADYSSAGRTNQYRLAAVWAPVRDIRFRASQGTAVRAPNIVELYAPQSRSFSTTAQDPCDRQSPAATAAQKAARLANCSAAIANYNPATFNSNIGTGRSSLPILLGGNPDLNPETAHTYELGVVIEPRFVPNLKISLDFFKYNLADQISSLDVNTVLNALCYNSTVAYASNPYCALVVRDPTGATTGVAGGISQVLLTNQNVARTKVEGLDASIAYAFETADLFKADYGRIGLRLDGTDLYRTALQNLPGQAYASLANQAALGIPRWRAQFTGDWSKGPVSLSWTTHFIGSMASTNAFPATALSPYYTGDYYSHDVRATYAFNDQINMRAGVLNVTDKEPPQLPETYTGASSAGAGLYDNRGRFFYVGATFKY